LAPATSTRPGERREPLALRNLADGGAELTRRLSELGPPLGLAALMVYLGFNAGGYFAGTTGWVAAGLAIVLAIRAVATGRPPAGLSRPFVAAAAPLALLALWVLISAAWSDATSRALVEFDRAILYLLVLLLFGSLRSPRQVVRNLPVAVLVAAVAVCGAGVFVRTLPGHWPFALPDISNRMDYPVSYENALGVLAAIGLVLSLHVAAWEGRSAPTRILGACSLPLLGAALVLTVSRGGALAAALGVLVYLITGWSKGLLAGLLATVPAGVVAVTAAYGADLLTSDDPRSAQALAQGQDLALILGGTIAGAGLALALLLLLERRSRALRSRHGRYIRAGAVALMAAGAVAFVIAADVPSRLGSLSEGLTHARAGEQKRSVRGRLIDARTLRNLGGQNRVKYWQVALDSFEEEPVKGTGAGTYGEVWAKRRPIAEDLTEGHSLYLETLAELGVVGALLLVVLLGAMIVPVGAGLFGPLRPLHAGLLAAGLAWLGHAALDWDWEMPVVTMWLFATGGCALAASTRRLRRYARAPTWRARLPVGAGLVVLSILPATVGLSQTDLNRSFNALERGNCGRAQHYAEKAASVLALRPEPHAVLAYCDAGRAAVAEMELAVRRDPRNWELRYGLAIVRGAAGLDPRREARRALRLNPREELTQDVVKRFSGRRKTWRREALSAPLPLFTRLPSARRP
jgi:O-antigen ligase